MSPFAARRAGQDPRWAPPALTLIFVNFIPVLGVLFAGWTLFEVVVLYWLENMVIGAFNVLKIVTCAPDEDHLQKAAQRATGASDVAVPVSPKAAAMTHHAAKLFMVPFFTFHYGMFCVVHGFFVFGLLGAQGLPHGMDPLSMLNNMLGEVLVGGILIAVVALVVSHLYSYLFHFLLAGEFRRTDVSRLMIAPYGRVVVLHLAIIFGAFAVLVLGEPMMLVLLLIGGKTALDWLLHVHSHRKLQAASEPASGVVEAPRWPEELVEAEAAKTQAIE